jgi:putative Mg2+ transporter-C (MgtC) family protein
MSLKAYQMMTPLDLSADTTALVTRLGTALVAGAVLGLDRELKRKPAGLRTHSLVAIGSALVVMVTLVAADNSGEAASRAIQGVITGIGFLGAGVIMQYEHERRVEGLTTAASIWVAAGLGMAAGAGLIELVLVALAAALLVLLSGEWFEGRIQKGGGDAEAPASAPKAPSSGPAGARDGEGDPPRKSG